jgi:tetratricopeptide (TPR) repeat protein
MATRFEERLSRIREANNSPAAMALVVLDFLLDGQPENRRTAIKTAMEAAAVPHWYDQQILSMMVDRQEPEIRSLMESLSAFPMVEPFALRSTTAYNIHETTRLALRKRMLLEEPERLRSLSAKAAVAIAQGDHAATTEHLYHQLLANPDEAADQCETLYRDFPNTAPTEVQQGLRTALEELELSQMLSGRARVEALLMIGWIRYVRDEASQLRELAATALDIAREIKHRSSIARALCLVGDVSMARGNVDSAKAAFEEAIALFLQALVTNPSDTGTQRDLSLTYDRLGSCLYAQGRLSGALAITKQSLEILNELRGRHSDPGLLVAISVTQSELGKILREQGRLNEASLAFTASLDVLESLVAKDVSNAEWQLRFRAAKNQVGATLQEQGSLSEAFQYFEESVTIAERIARTDPSNLSYQHHLSSAHANIGTVFHEQRRAAEALSHYKETLEILERMATLDFGNTRWQRERALAQQNVAMLLMDSEKTREASSLLRSSLNIFNELVVRDPSNMLWQRDLAKSYRLFGMILSWTGQVRSAGLHLKKGLMMSMAIATRDPVNAESQRNLAQMYLQMGQFERRNGDRNAAARFYSLHLETMTRLAAEDTTQKRVEREKTVALRYLAELEIERNHPEKAMELLQAAIDILERLTKDHAQHLGWSQDLTQTRESLAALTPSPSPPDVAR